MNPEHTVIIGASISGLACAACLQKQGINYTIIEKQSQVAAPWRNHYDRLHLHTNKNLSNLPYKEFGRNIPLYPSRQQLVDYLEDYQKEFNINPIFNTEAKSIKKKDGLWIIETNNNILTSRYVIIATGAFGKPRAVSFKGMQTFTGKILHSCEYKTGADFRNQNVLVVGFGNSACEIAIDLYEQGAVPAMSVRSPVNVIPRDVWGIPILQISLPMSFLPPGIADKLTAPLIRWMIGDITQLGLRKLPYGPMEQIQKYGSVPVIDIGTTSYIRQGYIKIYGNIDDIDGKTVHFVDGEKENFDAIVAAIGYYRDYIPPIEVDKRRLNDLRLGAGKQKFFGEDGLYFCGFHVAPTGQIREIALDAQKIARHIAKKGTL